MKTPIAALACLAASMLAAPAGAGPILYQQVSNFPLAGASSLTASQTDTTPGGLGNFATTYDNFSLASASQVGSITWQGGYYLPALGYSPTDFQIQIYSNAAGKPGAVLDTINVASAAANAVHVGAEDSPSQGAELIYNYSANVGAINLAGGKYWLSIVADLPYQISPPFTIGQWGWHSGTGGDGTSLQTFDGTMSTHATDQAFGIFGAATVPEPSSVLLSAAGLSLAMLAERRRRRRQARLLAS